MTTGFLSVYKSLIHSQSFRNFIRPKISPYPAGNVVLIGTNVAEKKMIKTEYTVFAGQKLKKQSAIPPPVIPKERVERAQNTPHYPPSSKIKIVKRTEERGKIDSLNLMFYRCFYLFDEDGDDDDDGTTRI